MAVADHLHNEIPGPICLDSSLPKLRGWFPALDVKDELIVGHLIDFVQETRHVSGYRLQIQSVLEPIRKQGLVAICNLRMTIKDLAQPRCAGSWDTVNRERMKAHLRHASRPCPVNASKRPPRSCRSGKYLLPALILCNDLISATPVKPGDLLVRGFNLEEG